ncbi:toxin-antitoxin system TumE family protein [Thiothrix subterranea]|uniref:DUF6516 family protein n=1 Tax=Thiothrix subterranea TaxID=2735563 RepID=A0AA51MR64_9GAMM|nr:DUF6516 family protein [Thiothrix subterranea]MDQ5768384.1 DUF6516 family protein [Thiothrix subterranea]WML86972.1 DUF6516 family protein [Thiothrix subterranea]
MNMPLLQDIVEREFPDIISSTVLGEVNELRIFLSDGSFVDVWLSLKLNGRYSYHWERRALDNTVYRHDNAPHLKWQSVSTFSKHYHDGSEGNVTASYISDDPEMAVREFLLFVRETVALRKE